MADWTSRAAPSILRSSANWSVMSVEPSVLTDVISLMPAIRPSVRSSGVATVAAIVSGLAPGSLALTRIVGKSTCGSGETGSQLKATIPASMIASVTRTVATGRRMKISENFTGSLRHNPAEPSMAWVAVFSNRLASLSKYR